MSSGPGAGTFRRLSRLLALTGCVQLAAVGASQGAIIPYPPSLSPAVAVDVGYRDFSYGSGTLATPTGEKPQSKLWWNDGVWWGCLWDPTTATHRIHRFDAVAHSWTNVGPSADNRPNTLVDVLWDGTRLYVVSHVFDSSGEFRLHSYTYDTATDTYSLRGGFPVIMGSGSAEALTIAKDTSGKLWITWEESSDVMVNRSTSGETVWGTAFRLPVQGNDSSSDDISSVIAFGSRIGILWSNQSDDRMYFSTHIDGNADTTWQAREDALVDAILGEVADDHLNLGLSFTTNPPTLFAATKTSLGGVSTLPQIYLLKRDPSGAWTHYVVGDQDDDHTRAIVQIDDENRKIYVIARCDAGDDAIRMKVSDMDNISFVDGVGTALIESSANRGLNNPTGTKQTLNGTTNLLVVASDDASRYYFHNTIDLATVTPTPDISVTPTSHAYGNVLVGTSSSRTFVVRNDGTGNLQVTSTSLIGSNPSSFAITNGGTFTLAPGSTRSIGVAFNPASIGARSATLRLANNDPNENPFDVALSGTGVQPDIAISPVSHAYGNLLVGSSVSQTFVVQNTGSSALNVTATTLGGTHASLFSITSGGGAFSLAAGATRNVVVAFNPTSTGAKTAALRFASDDPDENPLDGALSGTGVQPDIAISPTSHAYGNLLVGSSASQTFVVQNTGSSTLQVTSTAVAGTDAALFSITVGGGAFSLAAGATRNVIVAFNPTSTGAKSATLRFASDDPDENPLDVALSGTGVQPDIAVSPTSHAYGNLLVGSSASQTFVAQNTGSSTLQVTSTVLTGAEAGLFSITSGGGAFSLAAGGARNVVVAFNPTSTGAKTAALRFASDDPDENPLDVPLMGVGAQQDIEVSATAHDYGNVLVGASSGHTFVVRNAGTANLDVIAVALIGADVSDFNLASDGDSFTLAPFDSHLVVVNFAPATLGGKTATLRLASNDPDESPLDLILAGVAVLPDIAVAPSSHDFGAVLLGGNASRTFVVRNEGTAALSVDATSLLGSDAADFAVTSGGGAFAIAPGDSHEVVIRFDPMSLGAKSAVLRLANDDPDESLFDVTLAGAAIQQDIAVAPVSHDFGPVAVGDSVLHGIQVRNVGTAPLEVTSTNLFGKDANEFSIVSGDAPFTVAPGDSQSIVLRFDPANTGDKTARLRISSDDPDEAMINVQLAGNGTLLEPDIAVLPAAHDYGTVAVGLDASRVFVVRNAGSVMLNIVSTGLVGLDAADFVIMSGGDAFTLGPGDSTQISVCFTPTGVGTRSATLRFQSDDPDENPLDIPVAGNGIVLAPEITVAPIAHDFGLVTLGASVDQAFVLRNIGTAALDVTSIGLLGPEAADFALLSGGDPIVLAAGDSSVAVVRCTPLALGTRAATLQFASNDLDENPLDVALVALGVQPDIVVSPLDHAFATLAVGDSASYPFEIRNVGVGALIIRSTTIVGLDASEFAILSGAPFAVAAGDSLDLLVRYAPSSPGSKLATLHIESNDADEDSLSVILTGDAVTSFQPDLDAATTVGFGNVAVGASDSMSIAIGNIGLSNLHVASLTIAGPDSLDFILTPGGIPFTLAPHETSLVALTFSPTFLGSRSATLRLASDDPDENPFDIVLQGTGDAPNLALTPPAYDFGGVQVGTNALHAFVVSNQGSLVLHVSATTLTGASASEFAITSGGGAFSLAPGSSRDIVVQLAPTATGAKSATLDIASDDPDAPSTNVSLAGIGMPGPAGGGDPVLLEETASGGASNALTVTTTSALTAANGNVFLAVVSTREHVEVVSVDGMGLTWTRVLMQCGARATTGVEVWWGQGIPVDGTVSATFMTAPAHAAILVSRYSGADLSLPITNAVSANTLGLSGECTGGTDSNSYGISFGTGDDGSVVFAAVAIGAHVLTPGLGWVQRDLLQVGSAGDTCGVMVLDRAVPTAGSVFLDGSFDQPADWAVVALEIRAQGESTTDADHDPWSAVVDEPFVRVWQAADHGSATIEVAVPQATVAHLTLHDVRGHLLHRIWQGPLAAGRHRLEWADNLRSRQLPAGIYFVRADLGGQVLARKLLFVH